MIRTSRKPDEPFELDRIYGVQLPDPIRLMPGDEYQLVVRIRRSATEPSVVTWEAPLCVKVNDKSDDPKVTT
jgi:hypothetical protein